MTARSGPRSTSAGTRAGVSRRTLVAGTAWAVPAVIVATAAPAVAASCRYTITIRQTATDPCRVPGNLGYALGFNITRDLNCSRDTLTLNLIVSGGGAVATQTVTFDANASSTTGAVVLSTQQPVQTVTAYLTYTTGQPTGSQVILQLPPSAQNPCF